MSSIAVVFELGTLLEFVPAYLTGSRIFLRVQIYRMFPLETTLLKQVDVDLTFCFVVVSFPTLLGFGRPIEARTTVVDYAVGFSKFPTPGRSTY